jgi:type IV pilus biogenesis protein PilP
MSKITPKHETPANVAKTATVATKDDLSQLMLVGVSGAEGHMQALIRLPGGKIHSVKTGDSLRYGRVAAISTDGVVFEKQGKTREVGFPAP